MLYCCIIPYCCLRHFTLIGCCTTCMTFHYIMPILVYVTLYDIMMYCSISKSIVILRNANLCCVVSYSAMLSYLMFGSRLLCDIRLGPCRSGQRFLYGFPYSPPLNPSPNPFMLQTTLLDPLTLLCVNLWMSPTVPR